MGAAAAAEAAAVAAAAAARSAPRHGSCRRVENHAWRSASSGSHILNNRPPPRRQACPKPSSRAARRAGSQARGARLGGGVKVWDAALGAAPLLGLLLRHLPAAPALHIHLVAQHHKGEVVGVGGGGLPEAGRGGAGGAGGREAGVESGAWQVPRRCTQGPPAPGARQRRRLLAWLSPRLRCLTAALRSSEPHPHPHTHAHTHTRTCTHAHTHMRTHTHTRTPTHKHTQAHPHEARTWMRNSSRQFSRFSKLLLLFTSYTWPGGSAAGGPVRRQASSSA